MKLGIGIVGSGSIAKIHASCILEQSNAYLCGILTRNGKRAKEFASTYKTEVFTDSSAFFAQPNLNAVCVCNESGLHGESSIRALSHGKHVLCEKPLETTLSKIDSLIQTLHKSKLKLGVVFQNRMNPAYREFKDFIQSGKLGKLLLVNTQINWYRDEDYYKSNPWRGTLELDGGAALMNQGIHTLDLLLDLMGEVSTVGALVATKTRPIEGEDLAVAHFEFQNGALGTLSAGTSLYPGFPESISVYGSKGNMVFEAGQIHSCSLPEWRPKEKPQANQANNSPKLNSIALHQSILNNFIEAIDQDKQPLVSALEARKSVALIQSIYQASKTKQIIKIETL